MKINKPKVKKFTSFKQYAAHLEKILPKLVVSEKKFLNAVGILVKTTAKAKFGHYQEAIGPFSEWEPLKESTKADRVRKGFTENDPLLRTGMLRDSISYTVHLAGLNKSVVIGSTSEIMIWQELGVSQNNLPPRPVLGPAMFVNKPLILKMAADTVFAAFTNQVNKIK